MHVPISQQIFLGTDGIDRDWLRRQGWSAAPVPQTFNASSEYLPQILEQAQASESKYFFAIDIELATYEEHRIRAERDDLCHYLQKVPRYGDAIVDERFSFILLCPPREIFILAGEPMTVEKILKRRVAVALDEFHKFASDPSNSFYDIPGCDKYYMSIYKYYKDTLGKSKADVF